jgi:1-deoxy-D-xylulose-5-phosphate synthase
MVVMAPKDENELRHMLATAMASRRAHCPAIPPGSGNRGGSWTHPLHSFPSAGEILNHGDDLLILPSAAW